MQRLGHAWVTARAQRDNAVRHSQPSQRVAVAVGQTVAGCVAPVAAYVCRRRVLEGAPVASRAARVVPRVPQRP